MTDYWRSVLNVILIFLDVELERPFFVLCQYYIEKTQLILKYKVHLKVAK